MDEKILVLKSFFVKKKMLIQSFSQTLLQAHQVLPIRRVGERLFKRLIFESILE